MSDADDRSTARRALIVIGLVLATLVGLALVWETRRVLIAVPAVIAPLVAIADLIPLVGATLGAIIAGGAGILHSPTAGVVVLVFFVIYQQVENHLLQPVIMSHAVQLNPLTVLVSLLLAAELGGLVGASLAGGQEGLSPGSSRRARLLCRQRSRPYGMVRLRLRRAETAMGAVFGRVSRPRMIGALALIALTPAMTLVPPLAVATVAALILAGVAVADAARTRRLPSEQPSPPG